MNILFFMLVGLVLGFIVYKAIELNKKSDTPSDDDNNGGGGSGGGGIINNPDVVGELPKDNIQ
jgi:hypothetical protein